MEPMEETDKSQPMNHTPDEMKRILVVDDDQMVRELIVKILKRTKNHIDNAENGMAAYEKIVAGHFDLLVLDLRMPVLDGVALLKKLKQQQLEIYTIILTGHGDLTDAQNLLKDYKIADFIQKPLYSPFQLLFSIENALERQRVENLSITQQQLLAQANESLREEVARRKKTEEKLIEQKDMISSLLRESVLQSNKLSEMNLLLKGQKTTLIDQKSQILRQNQALARANKEAETTQQKG